MRYKIVLHKSDDGYSVSCPGLPGCWSQGATEPEALENIRDAIQEYLAAVSDLSRNTPDAEVREVDVTVQRRRSCPDPEARINHERAVRVLENQPRG